MACFAPSRRYRSVFLSDLHLGARACRAEALLSFLNGMDCERLYLLGDVVDGWRMQRCWYWPASHAAVLQQLLRFARGGAEVVYIPGNHDAFVRAWCGETAAGVRIEREAVHQTADGRRYLLVHGDLHDPAAEASPAAQALGDLLYRALLRADGGVRSVRRMLRLKAWSLAAAVKACLPEAAQVVAAFEAALAAQARSQNLDGVICGHIHTARQMSLHGVQYVNCGDWVENCSAVVENMDGSLEVIRPADRLPSSFPKTSLINPVPVWGA